MCKMFVQQNYICQSNYELSTVTQQRLMDTAANCGSIYYVGTAKVITWKHIQPLSIAIASR